MAVVGVALAGGLRRSVYVVVATLLIGAIAAGNIRLRMRGPRNGGL